MSFKSVNTATSKSASPAVDTVLLPTQNGFSQKENSANKSQITGIYIQPKLTVGAPDDPYEKEADVVADKVMRMPERPFIQRKCATCEKEEKIQRQEADDEEEELIQTKPINNVLSVQRKCEECKKEEEKPLQRKPLHSGMPAFLQAKSTSAAPEVSNDLETSIQASRASGGSMDVHTKSFMQNRFQTGFEDVRIHSDSSAAQMNKQLNAKAFTVGNNIYFNEGQYQPHTSEGKTLLAHELTHVIQQNKSLPLAQPVQRQEASTDTAVTDSVCSAYNQPVTSAATPTEESKTPEAPAEPSPEVKPAATKPAAAKPVANKSTKPVNKAEENKATTASPDENEKKKVPDDPAFNAVINETHKKAKKQKQHEGADIKVQHAEDAANVKDEQAIASGATVLAVDEKVNEEKQKPKEFNANEFKQQLKEKISSGVPNEEAGAREFIKDDKQVNAITEGTKNNVTKAQDEVVSDAKRINAPTEGGDKKSEIFTSPGIEYKAEQTGPKPVITNPERAIPKPVSEEELQMDKEHDADSLDKTMEENDLTDNQLAESEEPKFIDTLQEKQNSQKELCKIPNKLKATEDTQLQQSTGVAQLALNSGMNNMYLNRDGKLKSVEQGQHNVQSEEELRLQDYYNKIKLIYATTELNVKNSLAYLECIVSCTFEEAIAAAFETFKDHVTKRLDYYYDWHIINPDYEKEDKMTRAFVNVPLDEKIAALEYRMLFLPPNSPEKAGLQTKIDDLKSKRTKLKIELIFEEEKALFISTMDIAIDKIADMVAAGLNEAKAIISKGKAAVEEEFCCLDDATKAKAKETTDDFISKFSDLNDKVNDKETELSDTLAKQYNETASKLKDTFETIRKEAALSWWEKAWRKIKEIALIIYDLGKTLLNILIKAASVIGDIIRHPIRFFENLIEGITRGFKNFVKNLPRHLEEIIFRLIMGVVPPEITLPAQWDVKGIFSFVLDILGLSKANIRKQAVDRFGAPIVEKLEQTFELFVIFRNEGFAGLWEYIKEKIGNLKDAIIEEVKTFFKESIIQAAVEFLISALTPASGFIKVCKSIINIVIFLVKNLQNLLKLLDNILDSLADIAVGKVDKAANKVENAITDILLVGIKFLAALVGINLDKIQAKISKIINAVRNPVNRALKWLFDKAEAFARKTGLLTLIAKGKEKFEAGKEWAKEKVEKGKEMAIGAGKKVLGWLGIRKTFKDDKGENHQIYFKGKAASADLYVASKNPKTVPTLLAAISKFFAKPGNAYSQQYSTAVKLNKEIEVLKSRLTNAQNTNADKDNVDMNEKMEQLAATLPPLMTLTGGTEPPPLVKPAFANGVKANNFEVFFIKKGRTGGGSTANTNSGATLAGWMKIQQAGLSDEAAWVKMHLLTEQLGGPALDSNLTPARRETNTFFYNKIEKHAIDAVSDNKVIWYKIAITYHGAPDNDYPNHVSMEWGPYQFNEDNSQWEKKAQGTLIDGEKVGGSDSQDPAVPDFSGSAIIPNLNDPLIGRVKIEKLATGLSRQFAEFVQQVRSEATFKNENTMQKRLKDAYKQRTIPIDNFEEQVDALVSQANKTYTIQRV
ncbi:DUF4157 domain-containing protein [Ilyomonas limi]|uniref:DUF4157 domain-containing protein n=1 Tax=Ilyomonas limi TaxID=2575867 RepID=A0A4U3L463_9BACT|nr:DUF4157 domain-containing protein [Ilyomonas limi]TKK69875.1 DUF4157 domain-containing protein [Ilyomonas limi]